MRSGSLCVTDMVRHGSLPRKFNLLIYNIPHKDSSSCARDGVRTRTVLRPAPWQRAVSTNSTTRAHGALVPIGNCDTVPPIRLRSLRARRYVRNRYLHRSQFACVASFD